MIDKTFVQAAGKQTARVTFIIPKNQNDERIFLVGDFNNWDCTSHPFQPGKGGKWALTLDLEVGRAYQFRYFRDGQEWMSDSQADAYVYNPHTHHNFVVITDPTFKRYEG